MSQPHSETPIDDILSLVDRLTLRHESSFTVDVDGTERRMKTMHDPLLTQLRGAVLSSTGAHPGAGGLPSERSIIDSDALEQYENVCKKIVALFKEVTDAKPFQEPKDNLRQWYIQFANQVRSGKVSRDVAHKKQNVLAKIVSGIEGKLDPPTILEITTACPRCEATYGLDDKGVYRHAVIVESRIDAYKSLDHTKARCVACGAVWIHGRGMRQLRYEIDVAEGLRHADKEGVEQMFDLPDIVGSAGVQTRPFSDGGTL